MKDDVPNFERCPKCRKYHGVDSEGCCDRNADVAEPTKHPVPDGLANRELMDKVRRVRAINYRGAGRSTSRPMFGWHGRAGNLFRSWVLNAGDELPSDPPVPPDGHRGSSSKGVLQSGAFAIYGSPAARS